MTKQTLTTALLSLGAAIMIATPARAGDIIITFPTSYDSPTGYDFVSTFPTAGSTTIGTFNFTIPTGDTVTGLTLTGSYGNGDSPTTVLSDYYLGFSTNETAVTVAGCDDVSDNCFGDSTDGPYTWTYTADAADLATLASAIDAGSLDFTYTVATTPTELTEMESVTDGFPYYVYAGAPTIDISVVTPEPSTLLICFGGLAGIAALRRFRKA